MNPQPQRIIRTYPIAELVPYINWIYFFHAWSLSPRFAAIAHIHGCDACRAGWLANFPVEERAQAAEAMQLFKEAHRMLDELAPDFSVKGLFRLAEAVSEGDDLWIAETRFPLLRQQQVDKEGLALCLSDFIRPKTNGMTDYIGLFATVADGALAELYATDAYRRMLVQTLADRLAEAAAEKLHQEVRTTFWGYAPDEQLTMQQLHNEEFQGIRPAVGYPSLPDQSVNFLLDELLNMQEIGIQLTESGAMIPHASVSGLMLAHPQARYFKVGRIGEDQLEDYAQRRGLPVEIIKKFLPSSL